MSYLQLYLTPTSTQGCIHSAHITYLDTMLTREQILTSHTP